jgi:hypothetical protein
MSSANEDDSESETETRSRVLKTPYDVQRMRLEKLMKNPVSTSQIAVPLEYIEFIIWKKWRLLWSLLYYSPLYTG